MDLWLAEKKKIEMKKAEVEIEMRHHVSKLDIRDVWSLASYMYNYSPVSIGTDIVKAKGLHDPVNHIFKQITIIAKRMYWEEHRRLPKRTQEFVNGVESWVDSWVMIDMPILEAAHDEFMVGVRHAIDLMMDKAEKKLRQRNGSSGRDRKKS